MIESAIHRVVENMVANGPVGWTTGVLECNAQTGIRRLKTYQAGYRIIPIRDRNALLSSLFGSQEDIQFLEMAVKKRTGWDNVIIELTCDTSGAFWLVSIPRGVERTGGGRPGYLMKLDPAYELPWPGGDQEAGTSVAQGDPALAAERFREYLARRTKIRGKPDKLRPPASTADIEGAERKIGRPLPHDLRALYLLADGEADSTHGSLLSGQSWMSLEAMVATLEENNREYGTAMRRLGWNLAWDSTILDPQPPETVRRCGGHPAWIPIATDMTGNYLAVDMAPARHGYPGQVISIGSDHDEPAYVAPSVTSLLGHYLTVLESRDDESDDADDFVAAPDYRLGPSRVISDSDGLSQISPTVQAITISTDDRTVDLTPLAATPNLRELHAYCTVSDLSPLRQLPIESLHITLRDTDLSALAGHRFLRSLVLKTRRPVDINALRSIPTLRNVDLSGAQVYNLSILADLPDLRCLALQPQQWDVLLDKGKPLAALVAARLMVEEPSMEEALTWSLRLGGKVSEVFRVSGRIR
ncbi:MAG: hypothetical protein JWN03_2232 [Nocardia sp.]|uniref:SMI1/KNR4 family protein n=1 Tax=Nocardia sp. TaxID=1821 RepID=UPI00260188F2|nr:SMI1/KNR4 family protein [Nocardia sp.]MCU1641957.1 hypothetical protein [Nocardia sp.]